MGFSRVDRTIGFVRISREKSWRSIPEAGATRERLDRFKIWHNVRVELVDWITWLCWHQIWPGGFGGVRGLTAPIGLMLRASRRWLVAPMGLACPHAEEEA